MVRVVGIIIPKCKLILTIPGMLCNKSERSQVLYSPSMGMSPRPISTRAFYVVQLWYVDFYQDLTCALHVRQFLRKTQNLCRFRELGCLTFGTWLSHQPWRYEWFFIYFRARSASFLWVKCLEIIRCWTPSWSPFLTISYLLDILDNTYIYIY